MILAAALLLSAGVIGCLAPRVLHRLTLSRVEPATAIACWLFTVLGVVLTTVAGVALLLLPGHGPAPVIVQAVHDCWSSLSHGSLPQLDSVSGGVSAALLGALLARSAVFAVRAFRQRKRVYRTHVDVLWLLGRGTPGRIPTLWLDHDEPLAYSLRGRRSLVVATQGLLDRLSKGELQAVFAHEHAHLRGRHHLLVGLADVLGTALGFVPLMRQAPVAVRVLVELAADRTAVRRFGRAQVRSALLALTASGSTPPHALAMADEAVEIRLRRLDSAAAHQRLVVRLAARAGAAATALAPAAAAFGLLAALSALACLLHPGS